MPANITTGRMDYSGITSTGTSGYTIEGWFYLDSVAGNQYLVHLQNSAAPAFYTAFHCNVGVLNLLNGGVGNWSATPALIAKRWYYLCATCTNVSGDMSSGTGRKLFIDGVEPSYSATDNSVVATNDSTISVGGRPSGGRDIARGCAHRVRVYNTVIPPAAIAAAYADPTGTSDLATVYAANMVFNAEYNAAKTAVSNNPLMDPVAPTETGTIALTTRYPLDLPGVVFMGDPRSGSNTVSSGRITTLADLSGNSNNAVELSATQPGQGPIDVNDAIGIAVRNGQFGIQNKTHIIQQAAAGGMHTDSRNCSIVLFGNAVKLGTASQDIIQLGDPATGAATAVEFGMKATGELRLGVANTDAFASGYQTTCTPRMVAAVCSSTGAAIFNGTNKTTGSALSSATQTGFRIGDRTGAAGTRPWQGDLYLMCVYSRPLSDREIGLLDDYGQPIWKYSDPTRMLTCEGSSTMEGYSLTNNENIVYRLAARFPTLMIYNFACTGENRTNFQSQYATTCGAASTKNGFAKGYRLALIQPFGNDWDNRVTSIATILANYNTLTASFAGDYSNVIYFYPQPRTDYVTDTEDVNREADLATLMAGLTGVTTIARPAALTPANGTAPALQAVTGSAQYAGDEVHLSSTGYQTEADAIWGGMSQFITVLGVFRRSVLPAIQAAQLNTRTKP